MNNLKTPLCDIQTELDRLKSKIDGVGVDELPKMLAKVHDLQIIVEIRSHLESIRRNKIVLITRGDDVATVTSIGCDFQTIDPDPNFTAYCRKIQHMATKL